MTTTTEVEGLKRVLAEHPLTAPRQRYISGSTPQDVAWRRAHLAAGGHNTQATLTPSANAARLRLHPAAGYATQSQMISAAIEAFEPLDADARWAIAQLRHDWPLDTDAAAISLAVRWLVWHVENNAIETLHFG